jgi:prevent-host-death family protein
VPQWSEVLTSATIVVMKTIPATEFKAKCLALLDSVDAEGITITKHGKAVAKLVKVEERDNDGHLIGALEGRIGIVDESDDLFSTGEEWDAES